MSGKTLVDKVKLCHTTAFEYVSSALKIDEDPDGDKQEAVGWYYKGINELENGIAIKTMGASAQDKEKIIRLQAKMLRNLEMARERLAVLLGSKQSSSGVELSSSHSAGNSSSVAAPAKKQKAKPAEAKRPWNAGTTVRTPTPPTSSRSRPAPKKANRSDEIHSDPSSNNRMPTRGNRKHLKSVPNELANKIMDTAVEPGSNSVSLSDIVGQELAKEALQETVILPAIRPDLFSGLRSPAKGLLLFGPPGNGKTFLAKAVAAEAKSVFFNISASTLTSKWVGEGEKMVKALFAVAREVQPSIIFIDEIDSLLRARQENDHDAQRRLQTEFFLQFDGVGSDPSDRILVMGATNRPHELDDAALRRFPKRIYVRLPDVQTRAELLTTLLAKHDSPLSKREIDQLSQMCGNYSFCDLTDLAKDASLGPIREIPRDLFATIDATKMRKIKMSDFTQSLKRIRPSVSLQLLDTFEKWNSKHGNTSEL